MDITRRVELALAWLTGVTGLAVASVPLFIPMTKGGGRAVVDGQARAEAHFEIWLVDRIGVWGMAALLGALVALVAVVVLAATTHVRRAGWVEVVTLWVATLAIFVLAAQSQHPLGVGPLVPGILGVACSTIATIRQVSSHRPLAV